MKKILVATFFFIFSFSAFAAQPLVEATWLKDNLKKVYILDIRNELGNGSYDTFAQGHISGSVHTDYLKDGWLTKAEITSGQLPPVKDLSQLIGELGIKNKYHVVIVYGGVNTADFVGATSVYWTFKALGHNEVSILNGGYKAWEASGFKIEKGDHFINRRHFKVDHTDKHYVDAGEVIKTIENNNIVLVKAEPAAFTNGNSFLDLLKK